MPAKKAAKRRSKAVVKKAKQAMKVEVKQAAPVKSLAPIKKAYNKSQVLNHLSEKVALKRKLVAVAVAHLTALIEGHLKKGAAGEFTLPGLAKFKVIRKPAQPEREGINPFTKALTTFKARPARNVVKIRPLKKLKEAVN